jgi:TnpA family transposase
VEFIGNTKLVESITHFQCRDIIEHTAPVGFLSDKECEALKDDDGNFRVSLYKALLFLKIADALKSGDLSIPYSYKYLHLDDYLISEEQWNLRREDYIKQANDSILKKIDEISLYFNASKLRHTSSDGQKYTIEGDSLNANYSYKYHGAGQGVSSYIFVDDRFTHFYATVISSSEPETCYVLDGMMNNHIVKSDIHSTDTHGFTEVVFALMHMIGITFAPRLKNLSAQTLYGFKSTKVNEGDFIKAKKSLNIDVIKQNWDDILRFAATIILRYASASQLFKRLNSYSKQHVLYKALKEFGRLRKTLFILRYMLNVDFRQAIEKQLNRGENSNKLSKAVAFGNNQEIMFEEKEDQEVAENCRQLIKNAIILWHYLYLVKMLQSDDNIMV